MPEKRVEMATGSKGLLVMYNSAKIYMCWNFLNERRKILRIKKLEKLGRDEA